MPNSQHLQLYFAHSIHTQDGLFADDSTGQSFKSVEGNPTPQLLTGSLDNCIRANNVAVGAMSHRPAGELDLFRNQS